MKYESLLQVAALGLRAAEAVLSRRPASTNKADSRLDKVVARVSPMAERALDRVSPRRAEARARRRRRSPLGSASALLLGAAAAGAGAYVLTRAQQRIRDRYRPLHAPFAPELLDVLAAPGGGSRLDYAGNQLTDPATGAVYTLIDGIPDFIAPASSPTTLEIEQTWLVDLARPYLMLALGRNSVGNAALASAVASAAGTGWVLSAPTGRGTYELEMARANPRARVLCVTNDWDALLEIRRRANVEGLTNVYYARGLARLLPLQDGVISGVWTAGGIDKSPAPERELTQLVRVARPGAAMAGVSLVRGGPRHLDAVLQLGAARLPGVKSITAHRALLEASGMRDVRLFRDGAFVRFSAVRAEA